MDDVKWLYMYERIIDKQRYMKYTHSVEWLSTEMEHGMSSKWFLTEEERNKYIDALKENLAVLRVKAGISQADLCSIIGVSRQTYSAIETGRKRMMWPTYLALIFFFDSIGETRKMLRSSSAYPQDLLLRLNEGRSPDPGMFGQSDLNSILEELDDQAMHTLRTMILVEYARCKKLSGDAVVKAYDGIDFLNGAPDAATEKALKNIRSKKR